MATQMNTFTVVQKLDVRKGETSGDKLALALLDVLKIEAPGALEYLVGFLILKTMDTVYVTFSDQHAADQAQQVFSATATITQAMERIMSSGNGTRKKS